MAAGWVRSRCAVLALLILLGGCSAVIPQHEIASSGSRDEALSGRALFGDEPIPPLPEADILGVSAGMREFLADYVDRRGSSQLKLHQLALAVIQRAKAPPPAPPAEVKATPAPEKQAAAPEKAKPAQKASPVVRVKKPIEPKKTEPVKQEPPKLDPSCDLMCQMRKATQR